MYVTSNRNKSKARDRYLILSIDYTKNLVEIQKLSIKNNRKNIIIVKITDLYRAKTVQKSPNKDQFNENIDYYGDNQKTPNQPSHIKDPGNPSTKPSPLQTHPNIKSDENAGSA